jgi:DNA-binding XRE family transcriptional regulator
MPANSRVIHFLQWLEFQHPEQEIIRDLSKEELTCLIKEFEYANLERMKHQSRNNARRKALRVIYTNSVEPAPLSFERWINRRNIRDCVLNAEELCFLISKYLYSLGNEDLYLHIRSHNVLQYSEEFHMYLETFTKAGVQFDRTHTDFDLLQNYKNFAIRAILLYTTEDSSVQEYINTNYVALDKLSGDFCLVFTTLDMHKHKEDAYDFVEKLDVLVESHFNALAQLPGIFFWDRSGASAFLSFGRKPGVDDITALLRRVFSEVRKNPTIFSVYRARKLLNEGNFFNDSDDGFVPGEEPFRSVIKRERELRGWSQEELAQKLGCDLKTVSRWENGKSLPQPFHRQALCQLFKKNLLALGLVQESDHFSS